MKWNSDTYVADVPDACPVQPMSGISEQKIDTFGSVQVVENFIKKLCNQVKK